MNAPTARRITGISSMATRALLADLAADYERAHGVEVAIESVGGVDAARRVQGGEVFDVVVLASDALARLADGGHVVPASVGGVVRSAVAIAVAAGAPRPDVSSEAALREALLAAPSIGYSTGPSGNALLKRVERWGLADTLKGRLLQAPPGVPVGTLVARGEVAIGFQQLSELMSLPGVDVLGAMPPGTEIVTVFSAGVCAASRQPPAAAAFVQFLREPGTEPVKRRHGMEPA